MMNEDLKSPRRGRHVYVVLRWDDYGKPPDLDNIMATKAFETLDAAAAEASRLSALNAATGARYFVRVARLQVPSDTRRR